MRPRQVRYSQIVMLGVRHTRREREQLKDWDVRRAKTKLMGFARNYGELPVLPDQPIGNSLYRRAEHHSSTMILPWMFWRTSSRRRLHVGRRDEFCFAPEVRATGRPLRFMVRVSSTHASLRAEIAGSARSKKDPNYVTALPGAGTFQSGGTFDSWQVSGNARESLPPSVFVEVCREEPARFVWKERIHTDDFLAQEGGSR